MENMENKDSLLVSVDIGTSQTSVVVAERTHEGLAVLGVGTAPSQGVRKGLVTNVENAAQGLQQAVAEAEANANCEIHNVIVSLTGGHMEGISSQGVVRVKGGEVSTDDVQEVVAVAQTIALPPECEILHVFPQEFLVDGQERGRDPVGASGVRLETDVHVISVSSTALYALQKCCERAGLYLNGVYYSALAAAEAVLTPEEKELGVVVLDIGAGTTSVAAFCQGVVSYTAVLPVGGENVTNDLAVGLCIPVAEAERLKQQHGCALTSLIAPGEVIEMPRIGERDAAPLPRRKMSEIIAPRLEEIFELVREQLDFGGLSDRLGAGVVLTGGSALLEGVPDLAQRVFRMAARRGAPRWTNDTADPKSQRVPPLTATEGHVDSLAQSPLYAANIGLILCHAQDTLRPLAQVRNGQNWQHMRERVVEWFREFF